jgi:hypothetical protein
MEADDPAGIAEITHIHFTSRKEEAAKTGAVEQIAALIPELKPNCGAEK